MLLILKESTSCVSLDASLKVKGTIKPVDVFDDDNITPIPVYKVD